ncbi:MAG: DUF2889 domain-containing protein [Pseudomonadota bacterium]
MPLPAPAARERLHTRAYDFGGYRREDGLWDIEGRMTDAKSYGFDNAYRGRIEAGEPLHDMWLRLTVDEDLVVRDIEVATEAGPYAVCPAIAPNFKRMIGVKVGRGWRQAVRSRLGGVEGCTHLVEMLIAMATVTFQTLYPVLARKAAKSPPAGKPGLIDSCHAYRADGEVVKNAWPDHYTGQ